MVLKYIKSEAQAKAQQSTEKDLIELLIKNMGKYYPERSHSKVHASDVTKPTFCPRQFLLMDATNTTRPDSYIDPALRATFDMGNMMADRLVSHWMGQQALGRWHCSKCGTEHLFSRKPSAEGCVNGTDHDWQYKEVQFFAEDCAISGSLDLIADTGMPKYKVVELKIIKSEDFNELKAPLAEHRVRTQLYLHLIENSKNPVRFQMDTDKAKILYVSRGYGKKHDGYNRILPFKEFEVERNPEAIQPYVNLGKIVKHCRETKTIPIEKVCDSISCQTAKGCPVKKACWSGDFA